MTRNRFTVAFIFFGAGSLWPVVAGAQSQPADVAQPTASADLQEVVVTAPKIGESLQRAPIAAVTLSGGDLARLDIQSIRDAQVRLPSVVYNDSGGSAQVYIRGIGTNSAYAGLESSIGTYVDGVYLQRQVGASLDVVDLRSIDVLNGPQGTLYGRNATGGAILINTNDPVNRFEGLVRGTLGNLGRSDGEAVVNVPISSDLAFRVAAKFQHLDGYTTNIANGDKLSGYDRGTVRAKLKWQGSSRLSVTLTGEYHDERDDPVARRLFYGAPICLACGVFGTVPSPANQFYEVNLTRTADTRISYTAGTLNLDYRGESVDLISITGVRDFHYKIYVDQDFAQGDLFNSRAEEFGTTFTEDAFARSHFNSPLNFLAGLSGEIDKDSLLVDVFGAAFGPLQGAGGTSTVKLASISPYAEAYYKLTNSIKLTVGGRYNVDRKRLRAENNADATPALGAEPLVVQAATYHDFTPRAVLSYEKPHLTVYTSYSRGAKSGGFNTPAFDPLVPLRPETLDSVEAGIKATGAEGRLRLSAAAFHYDYKDIQVSFVDAQTGGVRAENAASAHAYGLEFNTSFSVVKDLTLSGGGLLEHARFGDYPSAAIFCPKAIASPGYPGCPAPTGGLGLASGVADLSGTRLPRAPEAAGYASLDYGFPIGNALRGSLTLNDRYTTDYDFVPGGGGPLRSSHQPAYNLVSASLSIAQLSKGVEIRAFVDNLTNTRYYTEAPVSAFAAAGAAAIPRNFGVSAGFSF